MPLPRAGVVRERVRELENGAGPAMSNHQTGSVMIGRIGLMDWSPVNGVSAAPASTTDRLNSDVNHTPAAPLPRRLRIPTRGPLAPTLVIGASVEIGNVFDPQSQQIRPSAQSCVAGRHLETEFPNSDGRKEGQGAQEKLCSTYGKSGSTSSQATLVDDDDQKQSQWMTTSEKDQEDISQSTEVESLIVEAAGTLPSWIPAEDVFARHSDPLHLPELDKHLSKSQVCGQFHFSQPVEIASKEERELYGWGSDSQDQVLEVAGGQLRSRHAPAKRQATRLLQNTAPAKEHMFPPSMLLTETSLEELKSNSVGPRAPPGGILGTIPPIGSVLGSVIDFIIGVEGSSFAANFVRLEVLRDFAQIMNTNLHFRTDPLVDRAQGSPWALKNLFFYTLPSIMALDFVSVFGKAVIFLISWQAVSLLALWKFWCISKRADANRRSEGLDSATWKLTSTTRSSKIGTILLTFVLTGLYLPLSKLCVDAITWSIDYWPESNDRLAPNVCYRTSSEPDAFNFAPIIVMSAVCTLAAYTIWFPWLMLRTIRRLLPRISRYNEIGRPRSAHEMEVDYERILHRDKGSLNFLYNAYRRRWGYYKPMYLVLFKLTVLVIVSIFSSKNCLWRKQDTRIMLMAQQSLLIALNVALVAVQLRLHPFVDSLNNRSETLSRISYVFTSITGLFVAINLKGSSVYNTVIMCMVQAITYLGNLYFSLAGTSFFARRVKVFQQRLDFSIDIFNPSLDMDHYVKRRIWQETLSVLLLSAPEFRMPINHSVKFAIADDDQWSPYLLDFQGTIAERHVENLKILSSVGVQKFRQEVEAEKSTASQRLHRAIEAIQRQFVGPHAYWKPPLVGGGASVRTFFGKAFVIPFPPTVVILYDQGENSYAYLTETNELEAFLAQNRSDEVLRMRKLRLALACLEGKRVFCNYVATYELAHQARSRWRNRRGSSVLVQTSYTCGVLQIHRKSRDLAWSGLNVGAGFEVVVVFSEGIRHSPQGPVRDSTVREISAGAAFGLPWDLCQHSSVEAFLKRNHKEVESSWTFVCNAFQDYRNFFADESRRKREVLTYQFLTDVFEDSHLSKVDLLQHLSITSHSRSLRELLDKYPATVAILYERLACVRRSAIHQLWWLFWDDLWRKNSKDHAILRTHHTFFSPRYPTSIAYRPCCGRELKTALATRGVWRDGGKKGLITQGLLNRLYFRLNTLFIAEVGSNETIPTMLRASGNSTDVEKELANKPDACEQINGGTTYERSSIVTRPLFLWEMLMSGAPSVSKRQRLLERLKRWIALQPYAPLDVHPRLLLELSHRGGAFLPPQRSDVLNSTLEENHLY